MAVLKKTDGYAMRRLRLHVARTCALMALGMLAACDGDRDPSSSRVAIIDSAGIEVIRIAEHGPLASEPPWNLAEELRISGSDNSADGGLLFGRIASVTVDSLGNIYAVDPDAGAVLKFDPDGALIRRLARTGGGPGELGPGRPIILSAGGDSVAVADMGNLRMHWYDGQGKLLREVPIPLTQGAPVAWGALPGGLLLMQVKTVIQPAGSPDSVTNRVIDFSRQAPLVELPGGSVLDMRGGPAGVKTVLFSSEPTWTAMPSGRLIVGLSDRYELRIHDSTGRLQRIVSLDRDRRPISSADQAAVMKLYRESMTRGMAQAGPEAARVVKGMLENVSVAEHYPMFGLIRPGPRGSILVQRSESVSEMQGGSAELTLEALQYGSSMWDVFDESGRPLGVINFPERFRPVAVAGDGIVGIETDSLGVQSIVRLRAKDRAPL